MSPLCCCRSRYQEAAPPLDQQPTTRSSKAPIDGNARPVSIHQITCNDLPQRLTEDEESKSSFGGRASAALTAVRKGLTRHLSTERAAKRHSSITIGSSEEEVARRAELRRLRDKRIQEELNNDHVSDKVSEAPFKRARHISSLTNLSFRGGGPRDTIEFVVQQPEKPEEEDIPEARDSKDTVRKSIHEPELQELKSSGGEASDPDAETADAKTAQKLPNSESHASFTDQFDRHSALGIWLAAQSMRSQDSSIARLDDTMIEDSTRPSSPKVPGASDHPHYEHETSEKPPSHKKEPSSPQSHINMQESTSTSPNCPPPSERSKGRQSVRSISTQRQDQETLTQSPSDDFAQSFAAAMAFTSKADNTSSHYTSRISSFEPSPARSHPNLNQLQVKDLQVLESSPFQYDLGVGENYLQDSSNTTGHENCDTTIRKKRSDDRSSYETAHDDSSPQVTINDRPPIDHGGEVIAQDACPVSPSDTSSFLQREAELATMEKRFGKRLASNKSPIPFRSRFKEDFDSSMDAEKTSTSLVPKIFVSRPAKQKKGLDDAPKSQNKLTPIRAPDSGGYHSHHLMPDRLAPPGIGLGTTGWLSDDFRPGLEESATGMWQRAIKLEVEQRKNSSRSGSLRSLMRSSDRSKNPSGSRSPATSTGTQIHHTPVRSKVNLQDPPPWPMPSAKKPSSSPTPMDPADIFGFPKLPPRFAMPPESWARYPSHNRNERTGHATGKDGVRPKDFAIRTVSSDGHLHWTTNKPNEMHSFSPRSISLYTKLEKAFKTGFSKLLPLKDHSGNARGKSNVLGRRRASSHIGGEVEYPELEVLPPGIGHLLEPEQVAERLAGRKAASHSSVHSMAISSRKGNGGPVSSIVCGNSPLSQGSNLKNENEVPSKEYNDEEQGVEDLGGGPDGMQPAHLPSTKSEQVLSSRGATPQKGWSRSFSWTGLGIKPKTAEVFERDTGHKLRKLELGSRNNSHDSIGSATMSFTTALDTSAKRH